MIITDWELKNFGVHEHLKYSCDSNVVGILGQNGSGKSTILQALQYAFTNKLKDNVDSYIRNYGVEGGAENASVKVVFRKGGKIGKIYRKIDPKTSQAKRWFEWDGVRLTKAKEIDTKIEQVLGVELKAIESSVFIPQGELNLMLFGPTSERESLFIKLLGLSYLDKVSKEASNRIKTLSADMEDLTTTHDLLTRQRREIETSLQNKEIEFNTLEDNSSYIGDLSKYIKSYSQLTNLRASDVNLKRKISELNSNKKAVVGNLLHLNWPGEAPVVEEDIHEAWESLDKHLEQLNEQHSNMLQQKAVCASRQAVEKELVEAEKEMRLLSSKELDPPEITVEQAQKNLIYAEEIQTKHKSLNDSLDKLKQRREKEEIIRNRLLDQLQKASSAYSQIDKSSLEESSAKLRLKLNLIEDVVKDDSSRDIVNCPCCGSKVEENLFTPGTLEDIRQRYSDSIEGLNRANDLNSEIHDLKKNLSVCSASISSIDMDIDDIHKDLSTIQHDVDLAELAKQLHESKIKEDTYRQHLLSVNLVSSTCVKAREKLSNIPQVEVPDEYKLEEYHNKITILKSFVLDNKKHIKTHESVCSSIEKCLADQKDNQAYMKTLSDELDEIAKKIPNNINKLLSCCDVNEVLEEISSKQSIYDTLKGEIGSCKESLNIIRQQQKSVNEKLEKNKNRLILIDDMSKLSQAFSRSGIPRDVMQHRFSQIVEMVQHHLETTGANFTVIENPNSSMSFKFFRLDDDSRYEMDQCKLSGGQRVRLSVAFLIAVQQLLVPDLGLLVLDEPSMHLDEDGVNSLGNLLEDIGSGMLSKEAQVIVCDHAPRLSSSFDTCIKL